MRPGSSPAIRDGSLSRKLRDAPLGPRGYMKWLNTCRTNSAGCAGCQGC
jgi:hypothetical protein